MFIYADNKKKNIFIGLKIDKNVSKETKEIYSGIDELKIIYAYNSNKVVFYVYNLSDWQLMCRHYIMEKNIEIREVSAWREKSFQEKAYLCL